MSIVDHAQLEFVLNAYNCSSECSKVTPLGNGLINHTYLVSNPNKKFVLQRINHHVFTHPEFVIANADLIDSHLTAKKQANEYHLEPIGQLQDEQGSTQVLYGDNYWRAIEYIPNCYTVEAVENTQQAFEVAKAFASFTYALSDFPAATLNEIIKDFHNLDFRLGQLHHAISQDSAGRLTQCQPLVDKYLAQAKFIAEVADISKVLPLHVTHNDTKINNLLFCRESKAPIAVIDLDTCMPGFLMHDFGDMVRTCCSNLAEDDTNVDKMVLRLDVFEGLAKGYVEGFNNQLTDIEKRSLVVGAQLLPFMIGVRFLTDFLEGDHYFQTKHDAHNLHRASNQFQLFSLLQGARSQLDQIVDELVSAAEAELEAAC